ncbi:putative membrane protein [Ogataea parapolymorpha DL-1]|uniref:Membrane protein n=1 Tax=Ogataea parapolymorpha (strain ATCC 26012 / BCRC 20466 / JCM 22074 / NRRL Y-7560 / DL-1) TaxID=871575 RepID=W1Q7A4_OGAPD|nr:putative membrane protein [Ogataea parapolymorpha DL-1]ESW96229.1 putative membrane protein [Ogataea parapolymorpha DL-1]
MASSLSSFETKTTVPPSRIGTFFDDVLANFHPIYFVINMGLGITSLVMYNFPIEQVRVGMRYMGIVYFFIDLVAFIIIHALFFLRYFVLFNRYDRVSFWGLLKDHRLSVFLGAEVMGFGSLINMIRYLRPEWTLFTYTLWWIQVALSLFCAWGVTFLMMAVNNLDASDLNATILLPVVTLTVASSTGSIVSGKLDSASWKLSSEIVTFMLLSNALLLAFPLLSVYFYKLLTSGLPSKSSIYSCFIPIGMLGQGAFAMLLNFQQLADLLQNEPALIKVTALLSQESLQVVAALLQLGSVYVAMSLVSMGICVTMIAIFGVLKYGLIHSWSKTLWASTFPLGTMAISQSELYRLTGWLGFQITSTIYSFALIAVTTYCLLNTCIFEIPIRKHDV